MRAIKIIISVLLLCAPVPALAQALPAFPMAFWGTLTINGSPAPIGTIVRAYYGSTRAGTVMVQDIGVYGYTGSTEQKLVIGKGAGPISFTIQSSQFNGGAETGGTIQPTYAQFTSGLTVDNNLAFTIPTSSSVASAGNSSGGGGSGGSGGASILSQATSLATTAQTATSGIALFTAMMIEWGQAGKNLTADLNHDGKVDLSDFTLLMINWNSY